MGAMAFLKLLHYVHCGWTVVSWFSLAVSFEIASMLLCLVYVKSSAVVLSLAW
jgi:hypothetical protein